MSKQRKLPFRLASALAWVMLLQALLGILFPEAYRDPLWARSAWEGNDWVTLLVGLPLLLLTQRGARKGHTRSTMLWLGALGFAVYNDAYYLFGAALNVFFPLYLAGFLLSVLALGGALHQLRPEPLAHRIPSRAPLKVAAGYLGFVGVGLGIAWLAQWFLYVLTGAAPDIGPDAFRLVAALDLTVMSPLMVAAAVTVFRRSPWGPVLCVLASVQGATYTLVLTAGSFVGAKAGVAGAAAQVPIWAAFTALNVAATVLVLRRTAVTSSSFPRTPATPSPAAGHP